MAKNSTGASTSSSSKSLPSDPINVRLSNPNNIIVNKCQKGNPVLNLIQSTPWEFGEILSDYQLGQTTGALFLSLKYHKLHPEYLHSRIFKLGKSYDSRILLILCDVEDHEFSIREITKICVINELTLIVAWSNSELSRYLQLYKSFEKRPPDLIKEKIEDDYISKLTNVLTTIKGVNKTDVMTLASNFGSFRQIVESSPAELSMCPGLGEKKVKRLLEAFNYDFITRPSNTIQSSLQEHQNIVQNSPNPTNLE
ncbi:hypothetical protein O181_083690 [Austropuccinia psidii MF-1]|uniref:DNA excision repair protein ERCC-1 n=1 Tax=Austropuccinia psidii MF-1 TaxID=1389203 RepID=A0A9Q3FNN6_9BASI|nr:hypothetical protein [Austropuccinia psidii MF-1]